jgi:hypothetical protein
MELFNPGSEEARAELVPVSDDAADGDADLDA